MKTLVAALAVAVASLTCSSHHEDPPDTGGGSGILCPMMIMPGLVVEVYDAVTGGPAACGATGTAESGGGGIQKLLPPPDCHYHPTNYLEGVNNPGIYTVTVERPGYQTWVVGGIEVLSGVCGLATVGLRADLQPL